MPDFTIEWEDMMNANGKISPSEKFVALKAHNYSDLPTSIVSIDRQAVCNARVHL